MPDGTRPFAVARDVPDKLRLSPTGVSEPGLPAVQEA